MIFHYLDASAWVKRYYEEAGTSWIEALFSRQPVLVCATLGFIEVIATLARKRKAAELDPLSFEEKARQLDDDWSHFIHIRLEDEVLHLARELADQLALRGADAVHLASAVQLQRRLVEEDDQLILVTSDQELASAARLRGLIVIDPQATEPRSRTRISWSDRSEETHAKLPRAYEQWTQEDDQRLMDEYRRGLSVPQLAVIFQRRPGAIRSRLRRLGLPESTQE